MFNHKGVNPWIRPSREVSMKKLRVERMVFLRTGGWYRRGVGAQALQGRVWCTHEGGYLTGSMDRVP